MFLVYKSTLKMAAHLSHLIQTQWSISHHHITLWVRVSGYHSSFFAHSPSFLLMFKYHYLTSDSSEFFLHIDTRWLSSVAASLPSTWLIEESQH